MEPGLILRIAGTMPPLDPALDRVVEVHWEAASRGRPLFNGQIFCADRIGPAVIEGHWTEYRRSVAQMRDPGLRDALGVRNLAVCGVLCCRDGVVIGRRDPGAVYQPGEWQCPPAGSVDIGAAVEGGASWRRALLLELQEELGLGSEAVSALRLLCLVVHPSGVLDLGVQIDTELSGDAVLAAYRERGNREYERLIVAPAPEIASRVAGLGGVMVPSVSAYLARVRVGTPIPGA